MSISASYDVLCIANPFCDRSAFVSDDFLHQNAFEKGAVKVTENFQELRQSWISAGNCDDAEKWSLGGSGVNVVKTLARLGNQCAIYGKVGADEVATRVEERLKKLKVTPLLSKGSLGTGMVNCFITPDSQRTMHTYLGATIEFSQNEILEEKFINIQHLHIEGYACYYQNTFAKSIEYAKKSFATVSIDLASRNVVEHFKSTFNENIPHVDFIFGNAEEMKELTGINDLEESLEHFNISQTVVATNGENGCVVKKSGKKKAKAYAAKRVSKVIDTTGAGDFFEAGFLHGAFLKKKTAQCVEMGNAAASLVIQEMGAELSNENWDSLVNLIHKI